MICVECKTESSETTNFCPQCGHPLKQSVQISTQITMNNKKQVQNKGVKILKILGYYICALLALTMLFTYFPQLRPSQLVSNFTHSNLDMAIIKNDIDQTGTIRIRISNYTNKMINVTPEEIALFLDNGGVAHPDPSMQVITIPANHFTEFTYFFLMPRLDSGIKAKELIFQPPGEKEIDLNL
jgi:hypothetical protein